MGWGRGWSFFCVSFFFDILFLYNLFLLASQALIHSFDNTWFYILSSFYNGLWLEYKSDTSYGITTRTPKQPSFNNTYQGEKNCNSHLKNFSPANNFICPSLDFLYQPVNHFCFIKKMHTYMCLLNSNLQQGIMDIANNQYMPITKQQYHHISKNLNLYVLLP